MVQVRNYSSKTSMPRHSVPHSHRTTPHSHRTTKKLSLAHSNTHRAGLTALQKPPFPTMKYAALGGVVSVAAIGLSIAAIMSHSSGSAAEATAATAASQASAETPMMVRALLTSAYIALGGGVLKFYRAI